MLKYGEGRFSVSGILEDVPQLETTKNGFELARFVLIVLTRNQKTKEEKCTYVPIIAMNYDAKMMTGRSVKAGQFYTITGNISTTEYTDKNGNNRLSVELVASKIMGGGE